MRRRRASAAGGVASRLPHRPRRRRRLSNRSLNRQVATAPMSTSDASHATLAYVALGANLGDPRAAIQSALVSLSALPSTIAIRESSLYRTESVGAPGPDYLNAVAELRTLLGPFDLLAALQQIENAHGRTRSHPNAPRTLDLDLLLYGDRVLATSTLTVPHLRLHERAFVLAPLAELAPGVAIPGRGRAVDLLPSVAMQRVARLAR